MEVWSLHHPDCGLIEVECGYDEEFNRAYPDWPEDDPVDGDGQPIEIVTPGVDAGFYERLQAWIHNPPVRMQIKVDGQVVRRYAGLERGRVPLQKHLGSGLSTHSSASVQRNKPHLYIVPSQFGDLLQVDYRNGAEVIEFDPPAGSRGEKRREAMESSEFKRVGYPLLTGLGKGGWALAVLLLGPLLSRFIEWLLGLVPGFELPDWQLPALPQIALPVPAFPQIDLPVINWAAIPWPDWELPDVELPAWVEFLLEYTKIWVPVVLGIVFAITAWRNHRKSERRKAELASRRDGPTPQGGKNNER